LTEIAILFKERYFYLQNVVTSSKEGATIFIIFRLLCRPIRSVRNAWYLTFFQSKLTGAANKLEYIKVSIQTKFIP